MSEKMTLDVVPLDAGHLGDAADLVAAQCRVLRASVPALPARYEDPSVFVGDLAALLGSAPGVAALRSGRLVGFLIGQLIDDFRGMRAVYSPEWANAAEDEGIYARMYQALARAWVADGRLCHLVTVLAGDDRSVRERFGGGFGMEAIDAVRDLSPVDARAVNLEIRPAVPADAELVVDFERRLAAHLAAAVALPQDEDPDTESIRCRLGEASSADFIACPAGEPVSWLRVGPANPSACRVIQDAGTASVVRAFTLEGQRGGGVGSALLSRAVEWAEENGYERVAVDFEPANAPAKRFWLRHFRPICYTVMRRVDAGSST